MLTAVTGINWGDEGKGRVVDLLSDHADYVVRYQGGNNAGHTVVTDKGKFVLNLLPSSAVLPYPAVHRQAKDRCAHPSYIPSHPSYPHHSCDACGIRMQDTSLHLSLSGIPF